jgi:hypothetical protein
MMTKYTNKEIRTWALVMAAILCVVGAIQVFVWGHVKTATFFWITAAHFLFIGTLAPGLLKPVYRAWLKFAAMLAWINTRLILGLMFYLVFAPIGLILRLLRVDLIKQRRDAKAETYWIRREDDAFDRSRYEKQY